MMEVLAGEYHQVATHARNTLPTNDFVSIKDGKFHFTKDDSLVIPPDVVQLRKLIQSRMPKVRIEKLLAEASRLSGCLEGFTPFYEPEKRLNSP
ncbi:hypothetical protein [Legionella tunisiensis]|uniref:hypothetical protein n=1 Tax=Legionella tunisiensis TaxID=1034944 RepID=UPI00031821EC|nr:hypothetical protein [Legionella tunisiensis]